MSEQSEKKPERKKPTYRHDPKRPIYNFPVHLLWGDSLMDPPQLLTVLVNGALLTVPC